MRKSCDSKWGFCQFHPKDHTSNENECYSAERAMKCFRNAPEIQPRSLPSRGAHHKKTAGPRASRPLEELPFFGCTANPHLQQLNYVNRQRAQNHLSDNYNRFVLKTAKLKMLGSRHVGDGGNRGHFLKVQHLHMTRGGQKIHGPAQARSRHQPGESRTCPINNVAAVRGAYPDSPESAIAASTTRTSKIGGVGNGKGQQVGSKAACSNDGYKRRPPATHAARWDAAALPSRTRASNRRVCGKRSRRKSAASALQRSPRTTRRHRRASANSGYVCSICSLALRSSATAAPAVLPRRLDAALIMSRCLEVEASHQDVCGDCSTSLTADASSCTFERSTPCLRTPDRGQAAM